MCNWNLEWLHNCQVLESYDRWNRNIEKRIEIIAMILIAYGCIYVLETNYK